MKRCGRCAVGEKRRGRSAAMCLDWCVWIGAFRFASRTRQLHLQLLTFVAGLGLI